MNPELPQYHLPHDPWTTALFILVILLFLVDVIVWGAFFLMSTRKDEDLE
jgi:hypothetical protein